MAQYPKLRTTNKGRELIASANGQKKAIEYTKAVIGDGDYNGSIDTLLDVVSPKMECSLISGTHEDSQYNLTFTVGNQTLNTGFFAKEIGIYGKIEGSSNEVLFAYTNGGTLVDYIPDKTVPIDAQTVSAYISVGDAEQVVIKKVDGTYITLKQLSDHNLDPNAHGGLITKVQNEVKVATDALATHNTDNNAHAAKFAKYLPLTGGNMSGDITINTHLVDYIIEEGSNGRNWYAKWKSGRMEQFVIVTRYGTSEGNGSISGCIVSLMQPFKDTDYIAIPINEMNGARNIWDDQNSASITSGPGFTNVAYNQSKRTTTSVTVSTDKYCNAGVYCVGRWK